MSKTGLNTGVTGHDGASLAALLVQNGHHGVDAVRRASNRNRHRLEELGVTEHLEFADFALAVTLQAVSASESGP